MQSQVLVGSKDFMSALRKMSAVAQKSLFIQAMTFEGDAAGEELIQLMIDSPAKDKRLLIDSFSKVVISDDFVFGLRYLRDQSFRREIFQTKALISKARINGIQVQFTNPVGILMWKYPARNHKKMMLVDGEVSFIGGINFSDHNFEWYDMMVEIQDPAIGASLQKDFLLTWAGVNQSGKVELGESNLFFFDGIRSQEVYATFFQGLSLARQSITIISPYISGPVMSHLKEAHANGVKIQIITPAANNKGLMQDFLIRESEKGYFDLLYFPGMLHMKAMLVDDRELYFGSSNYDLVSYYFEQELVLTSQSPELVSSFKLLIVSEVLKNSSRAPRASSGAFTGLVMWLLEGFCKFMS